MKLPDNYLRELVEEIAGKSAVDLVFLIKDRENVSEFKIAEKLNMTVNEVRNLLYRLQEKNLVFFTRKKDKKKGWYIYYWTFDIPKAKDLLIDMKNQKQQQLKKILKEETPGNIYVCPHKCVRMNAEQALEQHFRCSECDAVLHEEDVEKKSEKTQQMIDQLQKEIDELVAIPKPWPKREEEEKPRKKARPKKDMKGVRRKELRRRRFRRKKPKPMRKVRRKSSRAVKHASHRHNIHSQQKKARSVRPHLLQRVKRRFLKRRH